MLTVLMIMLVDDDDDGGGAWQDTQWAHKPMIPPPSWVVLSLDCDDGTHTM